MSESSPIQTWLSQLGETIPLEAQSDSVHIQSLQKVLEKTPAVSGTVIEALLWIRIGLIDPAHRIVQDSSRGLPAYIHGVVHRMEGDFWNSKYWFRQVQDKNLIASIGNSIAEELTPEYAPAQLFTPDSFVILCERILSDKSTPTDLISRFQLLAQCEWNALWHIAMSTIDL